MQQRCAPPRVTLTRRQRDRPRRRPPPPGGQGLESLWRRAPTLFQAPKTLPSRQRPLPAADARAALAPGELRPPRHPRPDSLSWRARLPSPTAALARFPQSPGRRPRAGLHPAPVAASLALLFPGGCPGPPGHPGNPGGPNSRLWGLGKAGRQSPAPGDLTP